MCLLLPVGCKSSFAASFEQQQGLLTAHDVQHLLRLVGLTGGLYAHQPRVVEGVVEAAAALDPVVVVEHPRVQPTAGHDTASKCSYDSGTAAVRTAVRSHTARQVTGGMHCI